MDFYTRDSVNLFHVAVIAPLLGYVAYTNYQGDPIGSTMVWVLVLVLILMVSWHSYLYYDRNYVKETSVLGDVIMLTD